MAFKMKSGMKPSFKSMGSSPVKQYADKNVSVDKVSDDGRTFTGTDSKGKTGKYKTSGYDAEVMQSDSVGVTGDAVSNMQMEFDMVKGTKYEKGFIDYHGKGNKPGTGKSPAKQKAEAKADPKVGKQVAEWGYIPGSINKKNNTIMAEDGSLVDMAKATRGGKTLLQHLKEGTISGSPAKSRADRKAGRAAKAAQKHAQAEDRGKSRKADRQAVKVAKHGGHAEAAGTSSGTPVLQKTENKITDVRRIEKMEAPFIPKEIRQVPSKKQQMKSYHELNPLNPPRPKPKPLKQTSHGPIREFNPPRNPNEGPYIVRSKPTGQTREPNNDGPDYRHIRERTGLDDGPHPERIKPVGPSPHQAEILGGRPKQLRNYDAFVKEAGSPAKKRGLWDNIHAKRKRGEKMREKGDKGAPTEKAMRDSQSPAKQVARMQEPAKPIPAIPVQREGGGRIMEYAPQSRPVDFIEKPIPTMVSKQKKTAKKRNKKITKRI